MEWITKLSVCECNKWTIIVLQVLIVLRCDKAEGFDASNVKMRDVLVEVIFGPTKPNLVWKYFGNLMIDDENGAFYHYKPSRYFCNECCKIAKSDPDSLFLRLYTTSFLYYLLHVLTDSHSQYFSNFIKDYSTSTSTEIWTNI